MKFKKAIVTSGPTIEWIDPVRFISNASSGKMGHAIAAELRHHTEELVYIHGSVCSEYSSLNLARSIYAETTEDMRDRVIEEIQPDTLLIMAAAPLDYRPADTYDSKLKKEKDTLSMEFLKNPDILLSVREHLEKNSIPNVMRVGFAAETDDLEKHALDKLQRKGLDYIVGNNVYKNESGFGNIDSFVTVFSAAGPQASFSGAKETIASEIVKYLLKNEA